MEGVRQQSVQRLFQHVDRAVKTALQKQERDFQQRLKDEQEKARLEVCQRLQTAVDRHSKSSQQSDGTTLTTTTSVPSWILALANKTTSILNTTTQTTSTDATMTSHSQVSTDLSTVSLAALQTSTTLTTATTTLSGTASVVTSSSTATSSGDSRQTKKEAARARTEHLQRQGLQDILSGVKGVSRLLEVIQSNVATLQADGF